jgi:predicted pyridoxine 5'-phosphate oxidase superfamily flavin-nucleotide-binding protein
MGRLLERIDESAREFIAAQHMFFVGTAPTEVDGHVNISPKGHADTFAVLDDTTVAYLDLTGSGAETAAHVRDNGRITVMFCAFEGGPNILRLFGTGRLVPLGTPEYDALRVHFPARAGARAVMVVDVTRVSTSCGFAVPHYDYTGDRDLLEAWASARTPERLDAYRAEKNATSIDGLSAFEPTS